MSTIHSLLSLFCSTLSLSLFFWLIFAPRMRSAHPGSKQINPTFLRFAIVSYHTEGANPEVR
ncbi:hypothetical protein I7I50_02421 [Histoplasma capsulatum G186AR]|uniref:Uncharacterized protein n=1 Tax=Ajellomyces capsulatus TaxID=5037 RepID=A0A8H7Z885_AJECA|nr:hypothetical protein I7I52_00915 [Histoplasma capsulatum]QSS71555.1 hypothetical protein I7I50_02421 [Histoplasma capsulatum G186AR]